MANKKDIAEIKRRMDEFIEFCAEKNVPVIVTANVDDGGVAYAAAIRHEADFRHLLICAASHYCYEEGQDVLEFLRGLPKTVQKAQKMVKSQQKFLN